jgi:hypothetical protein
MSQIFQAGAVNLAALVVPDVYVQILPPSQATINGVPTNILGVVGTATWGPVNSPTLIGSPADLQRNFNVPVNRKYDLATAVSLAMLQGANNFRAVRVTDGTDVAATGLLKDTGAATGATLTAIYTGTTGNSLQAIISTGSAASTFRLSISLPGQTPEVFDNIPGTGAAFWTNLVNAVNLGNGALRGPSKLTVASIGASTVAPATTAVTFSSGTDGAATITGTVLVGQDGAQSARKGMYALRGTGAAVAFLADDDDSTTFTSQVAYGLSEGTYMIGTGPAGQTIASAVTAKATAGIDSYAMSILLGDWIYWNDPVNQVVRLVSPQAFKAGLLSNLSPQYSALNKQVYGVVGTQSSCANQTYATADLQALGSAGIDLICNPVPAGSVFGVRFGRNSSSNGSINGDNYTRMTNFLASTVAANMGQFVGQLQSISPTDPLRGNIEGSGNAWLTGLQTATPPMIDSAQWICDLTNNSPSSIAAGNCISRINVRYLAVVTNIIANIQGGQTVQIQSVTSKPA